MPAVESWEDLARHEEHRRSTMSHDALLRRVSKIRGPMKLAVAWAAAFYYGDHDIATAVASSAASFGLTETGSWRRLTSMAMARFGDPRLPAVHTGRYSSREPHLSLEQLSFPDLFRLGSRLDTSEDAFLETPSPKKKAKKGPPVRVIRFRKDK